MGGGTSSVPTSTIHSWTPDWTLIPAFLGCIFQCFFSLLMSSLFCFKVPYRSHLASLMALTKDLITVNKSILTIPLPATERTFQTAI